MSTIARDSGAGAYSKKGVAFSGTLTMCVFLSPG